MHLISRLAMSPADPGGTFFIVTDSETCFQHWSKLAFPLIYQKITILLFDQVDLNIINSKDLEVVGLSIKPFSDITNGSMSLTTN